MRGFSCLAAVASVVTLLSPTAVLAADPAQAREAAPARTVLVCGTDAATRRAFVREHGSAPVFLTASEALSVRVSDQAWSAPRCMTAREHARFREATTQFAAVR